jgi:hypothetical protein
MPGRVQSRATRTLLLAACLPCAITAQVTEVGRRSITEIAQLTFGSFCDDRFIIRNDGQAPISLQYKVSGSNEMTALQLDGRELVELESPSKQPLELWMDGRLVAKAEKERRKCADVQGSATVAVAPLEIGNERERERDANRRHAQFGVGLGWGSPFFDPWWGPYGGYGYGFRPWYTGFYGTPIIIGGGRRGGRR